MSAVALSGVVPLLLGPWLAIVHHRWWFWVSGQIDFMWGRITWGVDWRRV